MSLYFITGNQNKFAEASAIISGLKRIEIDLDEIQEIDTHKIIEHKLKEALKHRKTNFIVEDGSLRFDCLGNMPGPLIKWFWKELGNEGLYTLCKNYGNFKAEASITLGYTDGTRIKFFEGKMPGRIVKPVSKKGFGFDPIFIPEGYEKTYHEMTSDEKNAISHRRKALDKLKKYLS